MSHQPFLHLFRRAVAFACAISLTCALSGATSGTMTASATVSRPLTSTPLTPLTPSIPPITTWRVYVASPADVTRLISGGWDVLEARGHANGMDYILAQGNDATAAQLRSSGFTVEVDHVTTLASPFAPQTYNGGYHTIVEHYQHMDDIVALHPNLAITTTYGVTWQRAQSASSGYDLRAICITKLQPGDCELQPGGSKPRFFMMAAIHARELTTAEMAWRWIDLLVNQYGVDPDITALLNTSEMWVVPVTNPDGRAIVETTNPLQRKNANTNYCSASYPGADLNRNAGFKWGVSGSTGTPCDEIYMGPSPASEPEESALEALMQALFRDQRGPLDTDAAPITTTGAMLTLHSYSDLVLLPWGWTECSGIACPAGLRAPNDAALRAMAFHMSYFNGYLTGQASEALYAASGTTDDWAYGVLGIPGFTFEIGPVNGACSDFSPAYSCQDGTFWPLNWPAFLYEAKTARQPYSMGVGPTVATPVTTVVTLAGNTVVITATIASDLLGNSGYDRPTPQPVSAAEYTIDAPPWVTGTVPISMSAQSAQSGAFGSNSVTVSATVNTSALSIGRHLVYIHGRSAGGYWGPVTAIWLMPAHQYILPLVYR